MSEVSEIGDDLIQENQAARSRAMRDLGGDSDAAAESMEFEHETGAPAAAIYHNVDQFKSNYKAQLTSKLLENNPYLVDYANSHPLATVVSNNDWHNLDEASEKMKALPKSPDREWWESAGGLAGRFLYNWGHEAVEWAKEFKQIPKDVTEWRPVNANLENVAEKMTKDSSLLNATAMIRELNQAFMSALSPKRTTAEGGKEVNVGGEDIVGQVAGGVGLLFGITPLMKTGADLINETAGPGTGEFAEQVAMLGMMFLGLKGAGKSHVEGGKLPPPGVSKDVDTIRDSRSKEHMKVMDEITSSVQGAETTEKAPQLMEKFIEQHLGDRAVYIDADAVRRLYGDKEPNAADNLLGFIPDLAEQLATKGEGEFISVPMKLWPKVDPELFKLLRDDMKVMQDDITSNEADALKARNEAMTQFPEEDKPFRPPISPAGDGFNMSRRAFLKGMGATAATAATGKVPALPKNPFEAASAAIDEMFRKNVEHEATKFYEWWDYVERHGGGINKILDASNPIRRANEAGELAPEEAIRRATIKHLESNLHQEVGTGRGKLLKEAIKQLESGWTPTPEAIQDMRNTQALEELKQANKSRPLLEDEKSIEQHLAEEGHDPELIRDIASLPEPEEYMKGGYPKGIIEPAVRNAVRKFSDAVDDVRESSRLGPFFAKGKEINLEITDQFDQPAFKDQSGKDHPGGKLIDIDLKEGDKPLGSISVITGDKILHVDYAHNAEFQPWQHGFNQMQVLMNVARKLHNMFPESEGIGGYLVSRDKYTEIRWDDLFGTKGGKEPSWAEILGLPEQEVKMEGAKTTGNFQGPGFKRYNTTSVASSSVRSLVSQIDFSKGVGGPLSGALNEISRTIADKVGSTPVHVIKDAEWGVIQGDKSHNAFYDPISHSILIPEKSFNSPARDYYILHEAVHAATARELALNPELARKIDLVRQHVQNRADLIEKGQYGFANADEFLAEALSNPDFQAVLAKTRINAEVAKLLGVREPGLVKTMWDTLVRLIAEGLGIADNPETVSALEAAMKLSQEAIDTQITLKDRMEMLGWKKDLASQPATEVKPAVSSMKQVEMVRSLARLEDALMKQAGLMNRFGREELRGVLSDLAAGFKPEEMSDSAQGILRMLDKDDVKNYINYIDNISSQARDSLNDYQSIYKKNVEADVKKDPFKAVFDAIEDLRAMGKETPDAPSIAPAGKGPKQPELPGMTRMEDRKAFETPTAIGMNKEWYQKYQKLIEQQKSEDAKKRLEVALRNAEKIQTKEYQETLERLTREVGEETRARPDIAVDLALQKGKLEGAEMPGGRRFRLNGDQLTEDQKAILKSSEYSKDGINPDDAAMLFGYPSGDAMMDHLGVLRAFIENGPYSNTEAFVNALTRENVAKQMEQMFGDLGKAVLDEAMDHVTRETQLDLLHEETVGLAMQSGMEFSFTKDQVKQAVQASFDKYKMGDVSQADFLKLASRHGLVLEQALLAEDYKTAFKAKQAQYFATVRAQLAKAIEKKEGVWNRNAKRFAKRKVPGVDQRYTNAIHDIMFRTGATPKPRRSLDDLADAFRRDGWSDTTPLKDFVDDRTASLRELAVPDWLTDPRWQRQFEQITTKEFSEAHDAVRSLIKNGRDEQKVISEGETADLIDVLEKMRDQISDLTVQKAPIDRPEGRLRKWLGTSFWAHVNLESMMNRLDRGDIKGAFKKYIMFPIAEASNAKDAMVKKYQKQISAIGKIPDMDKLVENNLFIDSRTGEPHIMRRRNVLGIVQIAGDQGALMKLLKGHNLEFVDLWDWLRQNTTPEDWTRARKIGDVFDDLFEQAARMQHELSGVAPVKTPRGSFVNPHGIAQDSWHNPVRYDRKRPGKSGRLIGRSALEEEGYQRATVPTGYLTERTGYTAEFDLNLDVVPMRMRQMIHDITMRPAVIQASKFFYNPYFERLVRKYYGDKPVEEFVPFLRDVANSANFTSVAESVGNQALEFFRQNAISTLIGMNPGTVMKHGTTALMNSLQQVGYRDFAHELATVMRDDGTGRSNWNMALEKSEELQRRMRNFQEIISGHGVEINLRGARTKFDTFRETMMQLGATPVATADLLSSVPTWLVAYKRAIMAGETEGSAITRADLAVRQTHGSSVMSNKPSIMRGGGALKATYASLYGFFSHMFQKQYEMAWKAKDAMGLASEGEYREAVKRIPELASLFTSYVIVPAIIEELVTPYSNSDRDSWGVKIAKTLAFGISSSTIGVRDFVHGLISGRGDAQAGLIGSMMKMVSDVAVDLGKAGKMTKDQWTRMITHTFTFFGLLTGLTNSSEGRMIEYFTRVQTGQEKPKGPWDVGVGLRYGRTKGHSRTAQDYWKHMRGR